MTCYRKGKMQGHDKIENLIPLKKQVLDNGN